MRRAQHGKRHVGIFVYYAGSCELFLASIRSSLSNVSEFHEKLVMIGMAWHVQVRVKWV